MAEGERGVLAEQDRGEPAPRPGYRHPLASGRLDGREGLGARANGACSRTCSNHRSAALQVFHATTNGEDCSRGYQFDHPRQDEGFEPFVKPLWLRSAIDDDADLDVALQSRAR
jgi:hypothetical protein